MWIRLSLLNGWLGSAEEFAGRPEQQPARSGERRETGRADEDWQPRILAQHMRVFRQPVAALFETSASGVHQATAGGG